MKNNIQTILSPIDAVTLYDLKPVHLDAKPSEPKTVLVSEQKHALPQIKDGPSFGSLLIEDVLSASIIDLLDI